MNATSKDVADILASSGLSLTVGQNLFIGQEPTSPVNCATVYDTPGGPPQLTLDKTERWDEPAIQVRVRNANYLVGHALIEAIKVALHGLAHEEQGGAMYELIKCDQDPFLLDYDGNGRPRFVCNFSVQRRPI
jgi:hypothetical protein